MRIKYAAIRYRLKSDPLEYRYMFGPNHAYCIACFAIAEIYQRDRMPGESSGFLTDTGEFVDRSKAYEIAEAAGQLLSTRSDRILYSEFVNMDA